MYNMLRDTGATILWLLVAMSWLANAACECGYSVNTTSDPVHSVFTELMENDFLHTKTDNMTTVGWRPQAYNMSDKDSRGPFGKQFAVENIETNPVKDPGSWGGESDHGGDAGLQLWVRGDHSHGFVSGSEMASVREDALYGSFRVGMKLSDSNGTCGAFFWFYNNSQEIDLEFLSKQFNESQGAVNLVIQTPESVTHGYDASGTNEFRVQHLPFRPDKQFHEYRFDWTPKKVSFYVDGKFLYEVLDNVPTQGGHLFLNHWSNGDPLWSAGPPDKDTSLTVSYVKAYFNSSDDSRVKKYQGRCPTFDPTKVCAIPAQVVPPDGNNSKTYFFSQDSGEKTPDQTTYHTTNAAGGLLSSSWTYVPLTLALLSWTWSL